MTRTLLLLVTSAVLLGGCAAQLAARDDSVCRSYGAVRGDPSYVSCRMQQEQLRQNVILSQ